MYAPSFLFLSGDALVPLLVPVFVFISVFVVVSLFVFLLVFGFGVVHCNVYAPRVLFMHGDALVCRQTRNDFDDNERDDDFGSNDDNGGEKLHILVS